MSEHHRLLLAPILLVELLSCGGDSTGPADPALEPEGDPMTGVPYSLTSTDSDRSWPDIDRVEEH